MNTVWQRLKVEPIINAYGPNTRLSGGLIRPEVVQAMAEATQACVDMTALQSRASEILAEFTGAEGGIVTAGAAAGLLLATAASMTGLDPVAMDRLPDSAGLRNEVVIARSQRNSYDRVVRSAGARLVEVGIPDRYSGPGVRDAEPWEYRAAISDRTAAVLYLAKPQSRPRLAEIIHVAHSAGVPVLVDAAAELPPATNLRHFIAEGADAVVFSGGKALGGPQGSGILAGRRELVASALLQMLDMDVLPNTWQPPAALFEGLRLESLPHHGVGRSCKLGKEQVAGLLTALTLFAEEDPQQRLTFWQRRIFDLEHALEGISGLRIEHITDPRGTGLPMLQLVPDPERGLTAAEIARQLRSGPPVIEVNPLRLEAGALILGPVCLRDGDAQQIARRLRQILAG
jgi:L-seryl-tRNA(Ser) seleniumtransferase